MPIDDPLGPLLRVPAAWESTSSFYRTAGGLSDEERRQIGEFLAASGPLRENAGFAQQLRRYSGRQLGEAELSRLAEQFEWLLTHVDWFGGQLKREIQRLKALGEDLEAPHSVTAVFFGFGDSGSVRSVLEASGFEHLLSTWNEEGWSGIDGDWVMHVRRVQPATEQALNKLVGRLRSACPVSDVSIGVSTLQG